MLSQRWNHFRVCSASNEMRSAYAQPAMKFVQQMLSIFWMMFLKRVVISSNAEHARKLVTRWLSMRGNWLLAGWACAEIGYSTTQKYKLKCKFILSKIKILKNCQRTHLKWPKGTFWRKKIFDSSTNKFGSPYDQSPQKCYEHRNSDEDQRKRTENFFKNWPRAYKVLI
jgi:hypothetical protein